MDETTCGRIPLVVVEIDQDQCQNEYGTSPCAASGSVKCFKTRATCQVTANYNRGTLTLRFSENHQDVPADMGYVIPSVEGVSLTSSKVNIATNNKNQGPLGNRSSATVTFADHPDPDRVTDPYVSERTYDPLSRGTFWSKWLARNPYYYGRALRIYEGYAGQSIGGMQVRHYIIERIAPPDATGKVTITAKDPLKLADGDRAKAPRRSVGVLSASVTNSQTTITIEGASLTDYPATGTLRIDDEVMTYASRALNSDDTITFSGVTRGTDGTTAAAHDDDTLAQLCLRYSAADSWDVAYELLTAYAGVSASYIPYSDWAAVGAEYLTAYPVTALITEPTDVDLLVGELGRDTLSYYWWDDRAQLIQMSAIRLAAQPDYYLNDDEHNIADSVVRWYDNDQRITEVWLSYDPTSGISDRDKATGYKTTRVRISTDEESPDLYGDVKIREINSRWIPSAAHAIQVNAVIGQRFKDAPEYLKLRLDAKDRAIGIGDIIAVSNRNIVDQFGAPTYRRFEVISAKEIKAGELVELEAVSFQYIGNAGAWMESDAADYSVATTLEKDTGFYWSESSGFMPDGTQGYNWQ
jgi:hypothetical protein